MTTLRAILFALVLGTIAGCADAGSESGDVTGGSSAEDTAASAAGPAADPTEDSGASARSDDPDPDALRAAVCDTVRSSFDCARAIEARQLDGAEPVRRHGDTLRLVLAGGDTVRFVDRPGHDAQVVYHSYQGRWTDAGLLLVQRQFYEGSEFLLVDDSTGARTRIPDWPVRSPDGRHFAVLSLDLVAGYGPNTLQVWSLEDGAPRRVWETEPSQWGPREGRWQDPETLGFVQHGYCGEIGGEGRRMCDRPATLTRSGGSWHLETGTVRDAR
jgi:hypothetical protein